MRERVPTCTGIFSLEPEARTCSQIGLAAPWNLNRPRWGAGCTFPAFGLGLVLVLGTLPRWLPRCGSRRSTSPTTCTTTSLASLRPQRVPDERCPSNIPDERRLRFLHAHTSAAWIFAVDHELHPQSSRASERLPSCRTGIIARPRSGRAEFDLAMGLRSRMGPGFPVTGCSRSAREPPARFRGLALQVQRASRVLRARRRQGGVRRARTGGCSLRVER